MREGVVTAVRETQMLTAEERKAARETVLMGLAHMVDPEVLGLWLGDPNVRDLLADEPK